MKQWVDAKAPTQTEHICYSFVCCYYNILEKQSRESQLVDSLKVIKRY